MVGFSPVVWCIADVSSVSPSSEQSDEVKVQLTL